jgi:hypothetical protein
MFKLSIEIEVPTDEHEEAKIVHDHMKAYIERGLGFYCQTAFHRCIPILRRPNVDPGNGNWILPAHSGETLSEEEVKKRWELEEALSHHTHWKEEKPEPEFLEEKDMKL